VDQVFIRNLTVNCIVGVLPRERVTPQCIELDIGMAYDCRPAGQSDDLADALDYSQVAAAVTGFIETTEFSLIEKIADETASLILEQFPVKAVRIALRKPSAIMNTACVGITIERKAKRGK
jgi:dihydroneopterin aldolase